MNLEWIATERRKLETEKENAIGMANQCVGALKMLAAMEAMLAGQAPPEDSVAGDENPIPLGV